MLGRQPIRPRHPSLDVLSTEVVSSGPGEDDGADGSEATIKPVNPQATQILPIACDDCLDPSEFTVSIRGLFDDGEIAFKLTDPGGTLPSPMPVFEQ